MQQIIIRHHHPIQTELLAHHRIRGRATRWCKKIRKRNGTRHVLPRDVPIMPSKEECVSGMVPRERTRNVQLTDVQTKPRREEYVSDMVQLDTQQSAAMRGAPILLGNEEYVGDMEPNKLLNLNFAAMKNVQKMFRREESVGGMVPVLHGRYVQLMDVPTKSRREDFVVGMVQSEEVMFAV